MSGTFEARAFPAVITPFSLPGISASAELSFLYFTLGLSVCYYGVLVTSVINQICEFLGIFCLTLGRRPNVKSN